MGKVTQKKKNRKQLAALFHSVGKIESKNEIIFLD